MDINEIKLLKEYVKNRFDKAEKDYKTFDIEAELDSTLSFNENLNIIKEKIDNIIRVEAPKLKKDAVMSEQEEQQQYNEFVEREQEKHTQNKLDLDKVRVIAILGNIDEGKTNLAFYLMNEYQGSRKKYLCGYPKKKKGYLSISNMMDLLKVKNGIIFMDEISKYFKVYNKDTNQKLLDFISMMGHKNNTFIFTAQVTQMITRIIENFIDCWCIKRIDVTSLKWGSKPKKIINELFYSRKNDWVLDLEKDEYLQYWEGNKDISENRIRTFPFQNIGKDWK